MSRLIAQLSYRALVHLSKVSVMESIGDTDQALSMGHVAECLMGLVI